MPHTPENQHTVTAPVGSPERTRQLLEASQRFGGSALTPEQTAGLPEAARPTVPAMIIGEDIKPFTPITPVTPTLKPPESIKGISEGITEVPLTKEETQADELTQRLLKISEGLEGKGAFRREKEKEFGAITEEQSIQDLSTRLKDLERREAVIHTEYEGAAAAGKGVLAPFVTGERDARLRQNAVEALTISSLVDAHQGRLTSALRKVERAVNEKYGSLIEEQDIKLKNLEILTKSPALSRAEKDRAEKRKLIEENRKKQLEEEKEEQKEIWKIATDYAKEAQQSGIFNSVTADTIQKAKTKEEALRIKAQTLPTEKIKPTGDIA